MNEFGSDSFYHSPSRRLYILTHHHFAYSYLPYHFLAPPHPIHTSLINRALQTLSQVSRSLGMCFLRRRGWSSLCSTGGTFRELDGVWSRAEL